MATYKVLVVANRTADSDDLLAALQARAQRGSARFTLLVPAEAVSREQAQTNLQAACERMREAGLELEGVVGNSDPFYAVEQIWDPRQFDEVIVSTLPGRTSKWVRTDLPHRIAHFTDVPVTHVVARERGSEPVGTPLPEHEKTGVLSPLSVLTWGGRHEP
jgi:hypothetical protein